MATVMLTIEPRPVSQPGKTEVRVLKNVQSITRGLFPRDPYTHYYFSSGESESWLTSTIRKEEVKG